MLSSGSSSTTEGGSEVDRNSEPESLWCRHGEDDDDVKVVLLFDDASCLLGDKSLTELLDKVNGKAFASKTSVAVTATAKDARWILMVTTRDLCARTIEEELFERDKAFWSWKPFTPAREIHFHNSIARNSKRVGLRILLYLYDTWRKSTKTLNSSRQTIRHATLSTYYYYHLINY